MKKLLLLLITSFIALGTSAVGINQSSIGGSVVAGWVEADGSGDQSKPSVAQFVK